MATGQATLDFGAYPGSVDASVVITGQTGINSATHLVEAWILPKATSDHSVAEHYIDAPEVIAGEIVNGTGFTIRGFGWNGDNKRPYYGQYNVGWAWGS